MPCDDGCTHPCLKEVRVQSKGLKLNCVEDLCHVIPAQRGVQAAAMLIPDGLLSLEYAQCPDKQLSMSSQHRNGSQALKPKQSTKFSEAFT